MCFLLKKIANILLILLIFAPQLSFAIAQETPLETIPAEQPQDSLLDEIAQPSTASFACRLSTLTDAENQRLLDLRRQVPSFDSIDSNAPADTHREELENNTALLPDTEGEIALKQKFPNQEIKPAEVAWVLNLAGKGAFAIGVVLDDTLRLGTCKGNLKDENKSCPVQDKGLTFKNDGAGIVSGVKTAFWKDLFPTAGGKNTGTSQQTLDFLSAELEIENPSPTPENELNLENSQIPLQTAVRVQGDALQNRVEASSFEASMGTTCQNNSCLISTYSMFDKYFNAMFSSGLVLSNIFPTLMGKTAYLFKTGKARGFWGFKGGIPGLKKEVKAFATPSEALASLGRKPIEKFDFLSRKYTLQEFTNDLYTSGPGGTPPAFVFDGSYSNWEQKFFAESAQKLNTYELRRKVVDQAAIVHRYSQASKQMKDFILAEKNAGTMTQTEAGQFMTKLVKDWDDGATHFDFAAAIAKNDRTGLNEAYVKDLTSGQLVRLTHENVPSNLFKEFAETGRFGARAPRLASFESDAAGALQVYKANPVGAALSTGVPFDTFEASVRGGQYAGQQVAVRLQNGSYMPATIDNLTYIRTNTAGTVDVFKSAITLDSVITPENFSGRMLEWAPTRIDSIERQVGKFTTSLKEKGWASRKYYSLLDKQLLEEKELLKSYLGSLAGAAKWTAYPFLYWYVKKGGPPGLESAEVSTYRLPDTWSEISLSQGTESIYSDAFVDFFSNAGSDEGDIFVQLLNKLPWKALVIDPIAEKTPWAAWLSKITGEGYRPNVENLAFFLYGPQRKCSSCTASLKSQNFQDFSFSFTTKEQLNSFIFEDTVTEKAKEKGQTLIAYSHHSDLTGKTSEGQGNTIDIADSVRKKETCTDATKEAMFGFDTGARGSAAILGGTEALAYAFFGLPGVAVTAIQQVYFAPKFNDCVDDKEGYFIHYFVPNAKGQEKTASSSIAGAEKASDIIQQGQNAVSNFLSSVGTKVESPQEEAQAQGLTPEELQQKQGGQGVVQNSLDRIKESTDKIISKIQDKDILQAFFKTKGQASGQTVSEKLFWFWLEGVEWNQTGYRTQGQTNLKTKDGNVLNSNYETGKISLNGKVIVNEDGKRPEFQRMEEWNFKIPAKEIPERLTSMRMPGAGVLMFETQANKETFVKNPQVLDCIAQAVLEQTGVPMVSENLAQTFGLTTSIETGIATVTPNNDSIIVEGPIRFVAEGPNSIAQIYGNRDVNVSELKGRSLNAGLLESIQFEHGQMVYNPQTGELVIWLKHHAAAIPTTKDVKDLKAKLTNAQNPLTGCTEPAIDLSLVANKESGASMERVDNFNKGLEMNGPFQVFETDKKIFMFYSGPAPECKPHFRTIDKATGEIYDQEIKPGTLKQTPTGVEFETADGKKHTLDFSAPDGKPVLTYNGDPQNLLSAQGRNGSFYFNPDTGEYFAENGQLIPLNDQFKNGVSPTVNPDGTVSGVPGQNIFAPSIGSGEGGLGLLNLPSIPEEASWLLIFVALMTASILFVRRIVA